MLCSTAWRTCGNFSDFSHRAKAVLFQRAQKGTLRGQGQFSHFIQKERTLIGCRQQPFPRPVRAGERAACMAEEMGFHQIIRHGGTIHSNKRPRGACAVEVQGVGEQILAGAGFSRDEHVYAA